MSELIPKFSQSIMSELVQVSGITCIPFGIVYTFIAKYCLNSVLNSVAPIVKFEHEPESMDERV